MSLHLYCLPLTGIFFSQLPMAQVPSKVMNVRLETPGYFIQCLTSYT